MPRNYPKCPDCGVKLKCYQSKRCRSCAAKHWDRTKVIIPPIERFWEKVNKNGPTMPHMTTNCWEWIGFVHPKQGYGQFAEQTDKMVRAHRFSYKIHFGEIPEGHGIYHHCDNRKCVRPDHLFCGITIDNVHDMINKGRNNPPKGEAHPRAKLTEIQVKEIKEKYANTEINQTKVAELLGISRGILNNILNGRTWKHI